ncbi:MAG: PHP domain-containing protein [Bacteroidales bacterium]|nr:PHP domain-containing protein [Bacteroidales bacterium]
MRWFRADLHIHTVLSPCGGLDMSPINIIHQAARKKLDIIAISDHNSTRHCRITQQIGEKYGISVIAGAELNTKEEIHCLAFFEDIEKADLFQQIIDQNLVSIPNKPEIFGYQLMVDEEENIIGEETRLLVSSLQMGIDELSLCVNQLGGLFVPAHINRLHNGIYSQLGFMPSGLMADALEITPRPGYEDFLKEHPETAGFCLITNSDAHTLNQIGETLTEFYIERPDFNEIRQALRNENDRKVRT